MQQEPKCTLTNEELIEKVKEWNINLARSGGKTWALQIPANVNEDPDLLIGELITRFKALLKPAGKSAGVFMNCSQKFPDDWTTSIVRVKHNKRLITEYDVTSAEPEYFLLSDGFKIYYEECEWLNESQSALPGSGLMATGNYEKEWEDFWKEIVCNPDGSINVEQVKKELSDFSFVIEQVPKVYCHITDSLLSKVMYTADTVIRVADDRYNKMLEEEIKEALEGEDTPPDNKDREIAFHKWVIENEYEINNRAQVTHSIEQLHEIWEQSLTN